MPRQINIGVREKNDITRAFDRLSAKMMDVAQHKLAGAAIAGIDAAIDTTPVDTGNARGNWHLSFGTPSRLVDDLKGDFGTYPQSIGPSTAHAKSNARAEIRSYNMKTDGDVIYINNNVRYIKGLDRGVSSKGGFMSDAAKLAAKQALKRRVNAARTRRR